MKYLIKINSVADLIGVSKTRLFNYLKDGKENLSLEELEALETALDKPCEQSGSIKERVQLSKQIIAIGEKVKQIV